MIIITGSGVSGHQPVLCSLRQLVDDCEKFFQILRHQPIAVRGLLFSDRRLDGRIAVRRTALSGARLTSFRADFAQFFNVGNLEYNVFVCLYVLKILSVCLYVLSVFGLLGNLDLS